MFTGEVIKREKKLASSLKKEKYKNKMWRMKLSTCVRHSVRFQSKYNKCKAAKGKLELYMLKCREERGQPDDVDPEWIAGLE